MTYRPLSLFQTLALFQASSMLRRLVVPCVVVGLAISGFTLSAETDQDNVFAVQHQADRLLISIDGSQVAEFVFNDEKVWRPYFANLRLPSGLQVTRNHPPIEGVDAVDHDTMHPGVWLGLGDISGNDFWRNKARMRHLRFTSEPAAEGDKLTFATECQMLTYADKPLCRLSNRFTLAVRPAGWLLIWDATFHADAEEISFGDQEEMGFGARIATPLTEKNGGRILNSGGLQTAKRTWGQPAAWCDYSGTIGDQSAGITLMAGPSNFRPSWWHNRDYGLFVANPFGRAAMKQGETSTTRVSQGNALQLHFGAFLHTNQNIDFPTEYDLFVQLAK